MRLVSIAIAALLAGCSGGGDAVGAAKEEEAKRADALQPGEYEISAKVDKIRSTDQTSPATASKPGNPPKVSRTCIPADGGIEPAVFAELGESCNAMDNYLRGGRMSLQYKCRRPGKGELTQLVDGDFTADSFEAKVITSTYYSGSGDYELTRTITGKRVGDCAGAAKGAAQ